MAYNNNNRHPFVPDIAVETRLTGSPNFSGEERMRNGKVVNSAGRRNFCIDIPADGVRRADGTGWMTPEEMKELGWPLRIRANANPDDIPSYYLPIQVRYEFRPPVVWLIRNGERKAVDEDEINQFDGATFDKVKLIIHPAIRRNWETIEDSVTAYLREGWFYLQMSVFDAEWAEEHPEEMASEEMD